MALTLSGSYNFTANKKYDKVTAVSGNQITLAATPNAQAGEWMVLWDAWSGKYDLVYIVSVDSVNKIATTRYAPRNVTSVVNANYTVLTEIIYDHNSVTLDPTAVVTCNNQSQNNGGLVVIFSNSITINGKIDGTGKGYTGGPSQSSSSGDNNGFAGYGPQPGAAGPITPSAPRPGGDAGTFTKTTSVLLPGSGGGSGSTKDAFGSGTAISGAGGNGGAAILLICNTLTISNGSLLTPATAGGQPSGYSSGSYAGAGGKGADGAVLLFAPSQATAGQTITATEYSNATSLVLPDWNDYWLKYLFQDGTDIKKFASGVWSLVGSVPVTETMFTSSGMTDLSTVNNAALQSLTVAQPRLLAYAGDATSHTTSFTAVPNPKFITPSGDLKIDNVANFSSITLNANLTGSGFIAVVASIDAGVTWQTWNGTQWVVVDVSNLANIKAQGMTPSAMNAISGPNWDALRNQSATPSLILRFGYYIEMAASTDTANTDTLSFTVNMKGKWKKAVLGSDYNYGYSANTRLQIQILANGDYKTNS